MSMRQAEAVANAVLYEGYILYPYRASAAKNRMRWQVGLIVPRAYAEATGSDPWFTQTECLVDAAAGAVLSVRVRGLHVQERLVEIAASAPEGWRTVDKAVAEGRELITWDEAVIAELSKTVQLASAAITTAFDWPIEASREIEPVIDRNGIATARLVRSRREISAVVRIDTELCGHLLKLRVRVENVSGCGAVALADRDAAVRQSLAGTHVLLSITNGAFVSLLEPPPGDAALVASCQNLQTFPVLAGAPPSRDVMLSSPIILYDYPAIAPESTGDFCDATEIDEMLTLRVQTLTDDEKQEARATDAQAARIIDRCDHATPESLGQLHGRWQAFLNPAEETPEAAVIDIAGRRIGRGARVRLEPTHRADTFDICLRGRTATVTAVHRTVEDQPYVAVSLDADALTPNPYRRALFFHPDELVPVDADPGGSP